MEGGGGEEFRLHIHHQHHWTILLCTKVDTAPGTGNAVGH